MRPNYFREALEKIGKDRDSYGGFLPMVSFENERDALEDVKYDVNIPTVKVNDE
jgi:hypothetical protein